MTATETAPGEPTTADELRAVLAQADPSLLVNCLIQLTGDASLLDRYAPKFTPVAVRSILESHTFDAATAADIVDPMVAELVARRGEPCPAPGLVDPKLFRRMVEFCVGEPADAEFVPILEEQAGFVKARRVVAMPRTPPPRLKQIGLRGGLAR